MNAQDFEVQDRKAWVEEHRTYVGGTGAAALLGLNRWKSPHKLYLEIVHGQFDEEASIAADMGTALEPMIRTYYERATGNTVTPAGMIRHPQYEFFGANPDGFVGDDGGLEIKTFSYNTAVDWGEPGEPQNDQRSFIPDPYLVQSQVYMTITGRKWWDVMGLNVGNREFRNYRLYDDPKLGDLITEKVVDFWLNHVVPQVPPPLTGHSSDLGYLKEKFPTEHGGMCIATASVEKVVEDLKVAWLAKRDAAQKFDGAKALIQQFMEDNGLCETMAGPITWRRSKDSIGVKYDKVLEGLLSYASLTFSYDEMEKIKAEVTRLTDEFTGVTRKGSRKFLTPFGGDE